MTVITRFAPSPTGYLHVGNVRTALINWLFARANGGKFILRIDDTDLERSKQEYTDGIFRDLEWLGLHWDEVHYQSKRTELHEHVKNQLIDAGRLYPCFETTEELEIKKKTALARNMPPIYDRAALKLDKARIAELMTQTSPHYRFLMHEGPIDWHDNIKGNVHFEGRNIGDPVLIRANGTMTYMIASIADDVDLKITDIIRGEDHITNSAVQIQMFEALKANPPNLSHLALLQAKDGEISKRIGGFDIATLASNDIHPMSINSFLAKIGTSQPTEFRRSLKELVDEFSLSNFNKAPTTYHLVELERINEKLTHNLSYQEAKDYLDDKIDEEFWSQVQPNLKSIKDADMWWKICRTPLEPSSPDLDFTTQAAELLPAGEFDETTWNLWTKKLIEATGRKGKDLFTPLRLALTGQEQGPELRNLLPMIGRNKVLQRLRGLVA